VAGDDSVRKPAEALTLAEKAAELTERRDPIALDVLAAAYAATGDFARAVAAAERALALTSSTGAAAPVKERLSLYKQGRAFRLPGRP
jgi:tetratricopeptide (TPR) repeat protein